MSMINSMSRMRGQEKGPGYTQTEAILGESMQKFGRELGEESTFGELQRNKDSLWKSCAFFFLRLRKNNFYSPKGAVTIIWKMHESIFQTRRMADVSFNIHKRRLEKKAVDSDEIVGLVIILFLHRWSLCCTCVFMSVIVCRCFFRACSDWRWGSHAWAGGGEGRSGHRGQAELHWPAAEPPRKRSQGDSGAKLWHTTEKKKSWSESSVGRGFRLTVWSSCAASPEENAGSPSGLWL